MTCMSSKIDIGVEIIQRKLQSLLKCAGIQLEICFCPNVHLGSVPGPIHCTSIPRWIKGIVNVKGVCYSICAGFTESQTGLV